MAALGVATLAASRPSMPEPKGGPADAMKIPGRGGLGA